YQFSYVDGQDSYNYLELFHSIVVKFINNEKYEELVALCYDVFSFDHNIALIPKILFTLINLKVNQSAIDLCEMYLKLNPNDEIFYDAIDEFLKYENYSGAIDLCGMYLKVNRKANLGFIRTILLGSLIKGEEYSKVLNLIHIFLEINHGCKHIYSIVHSMIDVKKYNVVLDISKLILEYYPKDKLKLLKIVSLLCNNGQFRGAKELCEILLELYPSSLNVLISYGFIFTKTRDYNQALKIFDSALRNLPTTKTKLRSKILAFMGWINLKRGDLKMATNLCIKSMKLNRELPEAYNNLGYVYYKRGYIEKAIKLIKKAIMLNQNYCRAWVNLGQIYIRIKSYYKAFVACYNCLCINNQFQEGINLYKELTDNPDMKILGFIIPRIIHLGYRCGFSQLNKAIFPQKLLKSYRYISYSEEFLKFLRRIRLEQMYLNDFVSIYCWLPKCMKCNGLLRLYGERINYKANTKTRMYRCENCGREKREIYQLKDENYPPLKMRVLIKSPLSNWDGTTLLYSKLDYEKIFITYTPLEVMKSNLKSKSSDLINNLENAFLLYGQDIRIQ
ncbi:MAG: tetratricopeptide repeat protein, partial [Promethearchaeota archaeon]